MPFSTNYSSPNFVKILTQLHRQRKWRSIESSQTHLKVTIDRAFWLVNCQKWLANKIKVSFALWRWRDWFWFWFWFYYALWLASVFTLGLVLRQSSENRSLWFVYSGKGKSIPVFFGFLHWFVIIDWSELLMHHVFIQELMARYDCMDKISIISRENVVIDGFHSDLIKL